MNRQSSYGKLGALLVFLLVLVFAACGSSDEKTPKSQANQADSQGKIETLPATVPASNATGVAQQPTKAVDDIAGLWYTEPAEGSDLQWHIFIDGHGSYFSWYVETGEIEVAIGGTYEPSSDDILVMHSESLADSETPATLQIEELNGDRGHFTGAFGDFDVTRTRLDEGLMENLEGRWLLDGDAQYEVEFGKSSMGELFGIIGDYTFGAFEDTTIGLFATDQSGMFAICRGEFAAGDALTLVCPQSGGQADVEIPLRRVN